MRALLKISQPKIPQLMVGMVLYYGGSEFPIVELNEHSVFITHHTWNSPSPLPLKDKWFLENFRLEIDGSCLEEIFKC